MKKLLLGGAVILFSELTGTATAALITRDTKGGLGTTAVKTGSSDQSPESQICSALLWPASGQTGRRKS